jgi:chitin synthase
MIWMNNIPIWERFSSFVFVLTYLMCPFLLYSLAIWIRIIIIGTNDMTFWILTGVVQVITIYKLLVPVWIGMSAKETIYYYLFYPLYFFFSPIMSVMVFSYALLNMDDFGWGKTR